VKKLIPGLIEQIKGEIIKESSIMSSKIHDTKEELIEEKEAPIVHNNVACDECNQENIQGIRYKCVVCANFDLC